MPIMTPRVETLRRQLRDLKALHDDGSLAADAHDRARMPLERELVDLVTSGGAAAGRTEAARPSTALSFGLLTAVLALAVGGYALTGSPEHAGNRAVASAAAQTIATDSAAPVTDQQVNEMVEQVAQRVKERPDDPTGWALLARAYSAMGRQTEAIPAFQKALSLAPKDASLLADFADALVAQNNGEFTPEALSLVEQAMALEPGNIKALALSGSAAYDRRDYATAVRQWSVIEGSLPADSPMLPQLRSSIAQARQLGGVPEAVAATAPAQATATATAPGPASVSGRVTLAPELLARTSPGDTVFIVARAAVGPRMPLAVLRKKVSDLPLDFKLDDSMAMAPNAKISDHPQVIVSARISKTGEAAPKAGDLAGQSAAVAPGSSGLAVRISEVVSP
jgi:cytochrome c-type biogenesis protein CcmH